MDIIRLEPDGDRLTLKSIIDFDKECLLEDDNLSVENINELTKFLIESRNREIKIFKNKKKDNL